MTTEAREPLKVFCSYAREDEEHLNVLREWLSGLRRQGLIEWWHDREIIPGWEWKEAIDEHLRSADIIFLLVTPDFLGSDYVYEKEIRTAIERYERHEALVIAIIVRPALWQDTPLERFQLLPKDAQPITRWSDRDEAWLDVVKGIRRAVGELSRERQERAAKERYRKAVEEAWADKNLSDAEAQQLADLASELGLSADTAADIEREVMGDTKEVIFERQEQAARERAQEEQLKGVYSRARTLHHDQKWQSVINIFDQIHAEDPAYPDPEGLLASAREALEAQEHAQRVAAMYDLGLRHVEAQEWQQALQCFEEIQRLKFGYKDTERLLSRVRRELASSTVEIADQTQLLKALKGHTDVISSVAFSPDGRLLASGSMDNTVRLWQVEDGTLLRTLDGHTDVINSVAFSPDGRFLASGGNDKTVRLWRVEDGALLHTLETSEYRTSVAFSWDGRLLASGSLDDRMLASRSFDNIDEFERLLASGSFDNIVRLWQVEQGTLLRTLGGHSWMLSVAFSRVGKMLASGSYDGTVRLWRVEDGTLLRTLDGPKRVLSVAFSPDGRLLASGGADNTVRLWRMVVYEVGRNERGPKAHRVQSASQRTRQFFAPTVDKALAEASAVCGLPANELSYEVVDSGYQGFLGIGSRDARILVEIPETARLITESQVELLKSLAVHWRGEKGVERLEDRLGMPLTNLTRVEADKWIRRLTPEGRE